ncbi:MAG: maltotransferase domain-containing protein, partial [Longimicrobiales bacterium]
MHTAGPSNSRGDCTGRDMAAAESQAGTAARAGRVVIEAVAPEIDCGRFPIKRVVGEDVQVEADV